MDVEHPRHRRRRGFLVRPRTHRKSIVMSSNAGSRSCRSTIAPCRDAPLRRAVFGRDRRSTRDSGWHCPLAPALRESGPARSAGTGTGDRHTEGATGMNELSFERRAQMWLEAGPTRPPDDAIGLMMDAIADVPQQPNMVARLPHRLRASRASLLATAAVIALVVAGGSVFVLRSVLPDIAGPRPHGSPLVRLPRRPHVPGTIRGSGDGGRASGAREPPRWGHLCHRRVVRRR